MVGAVEVRRVVGEDDGRAGGEEDGSAGGDEGKEGYRNGDGGERKGVVVFPGGEVVAFEGVGPHFCQIK